MFNRHFMDAVRVRLINIQAAEARQAAAQAQPGFRYHPDDVVAFVDLQNLHYFLKDNCRVQATQTHLPNLLREFASQHGMTLRDIRMFTGIHDAQREPQRHDAMAGRIRWLQRCGVKVTALPLSYYEDRVTKQVRAQEKGVDVRIASEILRAVNDGLHRALVVTQDKDISQAIKVAGEMALEKGFQFEAFSPALEGAEWEHNGKCGMYGVAYTTKLPFHVDLARRHTREPAPRHQEFTAQAQEA